MKTPPSLFLQSLFFALVFALAPLTSRAAVLLLDFGPTVVTGTDQSNSPYHTVNPSFTGTTWSQVQTTDIAAGGLQYSDGSTATGLTLNLGATTVAGSTTLGLATTPSGNSALGASVNTGVYAGTSVGKDGIYTGNNGNSQRYVGFQLGGLAAGTYDIYVTARNTSSTVSYGETLFAGASATSGDFDASLLSSDSISFTGSTATSAWAQSGNYLKLTVTLATGNYLNLATTGSNAELRGFLNSVEIVSVPEPSTIVLLGSAALTLWTFRRRRQ